MEALIVHSREVNEFYTEEGCYISETWNTDKDPDVSIAKARVELGKTTEKHALNGIIERYLIIKGKGLVDIEGLGGWRKVEKGDVIFIPANSTQRIKNTGNVDLEFYCICSPRFDNYSYEQR